MKHDLLEEVWRVRDQISAECGHDLKKLAAMLRREEAKYGDRLARLPIRRKSAPTEEQTFGERLVQPPPHGVPSKPASALREELPPYGGKARGTKH